MVAGAVRWGRMRQLPSIPSLRTPAGRPKCGPGAFISCVAVLLALAGCGDPPTQAAGSDLVLVLPDVQVTVADFHRWVEENIPSVEYESLGNEALSRLLDQMLEEEILLQAALSQGIEVESMEVEAYLRQWGEPSNVRDPALRREVRRRLLIKRFREEHLMANLEYGEQDLRAIYEEEHDAMREPARYRIRHIFLDKEDAILEVRDLLDEGRPFEEVAAVLNRTPVQAEPHWVEEPNLPPVLADALRDLPPGERTPVLQTPEGYHILMLEERVEGGVPSFEQVRERIEKDLLRRLTDQRIQQTIEEMTSREPFVFMPENLDFQYIP